MEKAKGASEAEALGRLQEVSLARSGGAVSISNRKLNEDARNAPQARGFLVIEAPADAPVLIHSSFSSVEVRDLGAPVRLAAAHARATILDTTGMVDATAEVIDFAGSLGQLTLSAQAEINLKMRANRFDGTLLAWAQRSVRMLVPPHFATGFQATVNRPEGFVCHAAFCSKIQLQRQGNLYVFTYPGDAPAEPLPLHLRSESSTVVIYSTDQLPKS